MSSGGDKTKMCVRVGPLTAPASSLRVQLMKQRGLEPSHHREKPARKNKVERVKGERARKS